MAWGRRCDVGCESWPDDDAYDECPVCGEPTVRFSNLRPLDETEARTLRLQLEFEHYYVEYCENKGQPVDGPLPMSPEDEAKWDEKYPGGKPDGPNLVPS